MFKWFTSLGKQVSNDKNEDKHTDHKTKKKKKQHGTTIRTRTL